MKKILDNQMTIDLRNAYEIVKAYRKTPRPSLLKLEELLSNEVMNRLQTLIEQNNETTGISGE